MKARHTHSNDVKTIKALRDLVEQAGISTVDWGKGQAKTLRHLVKEIKDGETLLVTDENGRPVRIVVVGNVDVYYESPGGNLLRLKEDRQVFEGGRERRRDLGAAVSEKIKPNEAPAEAAIRGIREELGLVGPIELIEEGTTQETMESPSYPGIRTQYTRHKFRVILNDRQYKPEGYIEVQEDKTTYFIWEKVEIVNLKRET